MLLQFFAKLGRRGSASVEFAICATFIFIPVFFGTVELATVYRTYAKLDAMTNNVARMVALSQAVTTAAPPVSPVSISQLPVAAYSNQETPTSLADVCQGAITGMAPFPTTGMKLDVATITNETIGGTPLATTDKWEYDQTVGNGVVCGGNSTATLLGTAAILATAYGLIPSECDNVIVVQATVPYSGLFGMFVPAGFTLTQTIYTRWSINTPQTELMCAGCIVVPLGTGGGTSPAGTSTLSPPLSNAVTQICDSNNQDIH